MNASIFSVYMSNISKEVIESQEKVVRRLLPDGWTFEQLFTNKRHPEALEEAVEMNKNDITIILDIDCIPLTQRALLWLVDNVRQSDEHGLWHGLVGAVQRANHIENDRHLYVGPFCMAFSKAYYKEIGSPSFNETARGDVGEELTYKWSEQSTHIASAGKDKYRYAGDIHFMWPSSMKQPMWDLDFGIRFGIGTTYGAAGTGPYMFYHSFNARDPKTQESFIWECNRTMMRQGVAA